MGYKIFRCESCSAQVAVDDKVKEKPIACPKCRGMIIFDRLEGEVEGKIYECPECDNSFAYKGVPYKCTFCDHNFSRKDRYF